MGNIKSKIGKCIDCGPDSPDKFIIAGRCYTSTPFHYQKHKEALYKAKSAERKAKRQNKIGNELTLGKWFNMQINAMPGYCEECGEYINRFAPWTARAYIAHIVPKRYFESVMVHPDNRMFYCIDCHTKFDNCLSEEVKQMKSYPLILKRFKLFAKDIDLKEIEHLRPFLQDIYFSL